jgi:hypothetical protein
MSDPGFTVDVDINVEWFTSAVPTALGKIPVVAEY